MGLFDGILGGIGSAVGSFLGTNKPLAKTASRAASSGGFGLGSVLDSFLPNSRTINTSSGSGVRNFSPIPNPSAGRITTTGNSRISNGVGNIMSGFINKTPISPARNANPAQFLKAQKPPQTGGGIFGAFNTLNATSPFKPKGLASTQGLLNYSTPGSGSGMMDQLKGKLGDKFKDLLSDPNKLKELYEKVKGLFGGGGDGGGGGEVPGAPGLEGELEGQLKEFGLAGPLNASIMMRLKELLDQPIQTISGDEEAAILRDIDKQEQQELDFVMDQYKNLRPGADIESDSSFRRDVGEVREKYGRVKQDALARARRQVRDDYTRNLLNALQLGQRSGEFTTDSLFGINNNQIERLADQFGLNFEQRQRLNDTFGLTPFGF